MLRQCCDAIVDRLQVGFVGAIHEVGLTKKEVLIERDCTTGFYRPDFDLLGQKPPIVSKACVFCLLCVGSGLKGQWQTLTHLRSISCLRQGRPVAYAAVIMSPNRPFKKADQSDPSTLLFLENLLDNQLGPDAQRLKFLKYEKVSGRRSLVEMLTTDLFESNINQIAGS